MTTTVDGSVLFRAWNSAYARTEQALVRVESGAHMARGVKTETKGTSSRREEILAVAAEVIAERGIAGATVRDIGQAAGILSGSLYYHFDSKEQIVLDLLLDNVQTEHDASVALAAAGGDPVEILSSLMRGSIRQTAAHPNQSLILRNESRAFNSSEALAPLAELRAEAVVLWNGVVQRGIDEGAFRGDLDAEVTVRAMFDALLGAARWFVGDNRLDAEAVADEIIAVFLGGMLAR
jgi:AcrR family transcriptional regulator